MGSVDAVGDDPVALRELAVRLATSAGDLAQRGQAERFAAGGVGRKSSDTDLVTAYDRAAEQHLVDGLRRARPDDGIVGEEGAAVTGTSGLVWYLDPIDGTTNYVHGHPLWATSVAVGHDGEMLAGTVEHDGEMVAGAVVAPALGETFAAAVGSGATCNGEPIASRPCEELARAVVATGFAYDARRRRAQAARIAALIDRVADVRRGGSAALDLCFVAAGRVDGYFEEFLNVWDLAAGELIAREAGCVSGPIGDGSGESRADGLWSGLCVAAPGVFAALRDVVATTSAG